MIEIQILKDFIIFLKKENILKEFVHCFENDSFYRSTFSNDYPSGEFIADQIKYRPDEIILNSFSWHTNDSCDVDWEYISDKWEDFLEKKYEI